MSFFWGGSLKAVFAKCLWTLPSLTFLFMINKPNSCSPLYINEYSRAWWVSFTSWNARARPLQPKINTKRKKKHTSYGIQGSWSLPFSRNLIKTPFELSKPDETLVKRSSQVWIPAHFFCQLIYIKIVLKNDLNQ